MGELYTTKVWLHGISQGKSSLLTEVQAALCQAGIECCRTPQPGADLAIVLLDEACLPEEGFSALPDILSAQDHVIVFNTGCKALPLYQVSKLMDLGVDELLCRQHLEELGGMIRSRLVRWKIIDKQLRTARVRRHLIGEHPCWKKMLRKVVEIACFSTHPVLLCGDTGTGKELIASLIHDLDRRPDKESLILLDCSTIVPELSGSEFFGHEKGAFTNAVSSRDGAFALADRGSLFLDEIGELPLKLQAELLRVIQEGSYKRVGSNIWKKTNFRLICATNRNLLAEMEAQRFRRDLYYRLSTTVVRLPGLSERKSDIPLLASHFLKELLQSDPAPEIDKQVRNFLLTHHYAGNVRELKQLVARMACRYTGVGPITVGTLQFGEEVPGQSKRTHWLDNGFREALQEALANGLGLKDIKRLTGDAVMEIAIREAAGNLQEAARILEVSDRTLQVYQAAQKNEKEDTIDAN